MKYLYWDCCSGISGDMVVGALVDLGVDRDELLSGLHSLGISGWSASFKQEQKGPLTGTAFRVLLDGGIPKEERSLREIKKIIGGSRLSLRAKSWATNAFQLLGEAEAGIHGVPVEDVHFHEVGATDSIIDILGAAIGLDLLDVDEIRGSPLPMARGYVRCRHGLIPLPAPATLSLAKGLPLRPPPAPTARELCTPTGLAILKATAAGFGDIPEGTLNGVGYGLGTAELPWPNVLRALLLESAPSGQASREVLLFEANIDDMTGEALAHAVDRILEEGALDAWLIPMHMKKGRPAFQLGIMCDTSLGDHITDVLLGETSTLGFRRRVVERTVLPRRSITVETPFGPIGCKVGLLPSGKRRAKPEFEDCKRAAQAAGHPLWEVMESALQAALSSRKFATEAEDPD